MNTKDWKKIIGSVAPTIGAALGGPFGGIAGKFVADALGVEPDALPETVTNSDPDTLFKIKSLENDFKVQMAELGIQEEQLHHEDRDSARQMAVQTSLKPQATIATVFIIGFIVTLYGVFSGEVDLTPQQAQMANILIGILSAGIMQIMNFFFGSSSGSKEKTAQLVNTKPRVID